MALAAFVPVTVFAGGWVTGGAYLGFRDKRAFDLMVVSVSSFVFIWITTAFPYTAFVFGKAVARYWQRNVFHSDFSCKFVQIVLQGTSREG